MIPKGNTIEEIKQREQIIRDFYSDWKEKIGADGGLKIVNLSKPVLLLDEITHLPTRL